jgi:hypothetical protein
MLRLLKLAFVGLISYAAYEFIRGLLSDGDGGQGMAGTSGPRSPALAKALDRDAGRSNMTGPGGGERVMTEESSGESVPHIVGRGVVRR